MMPPENAQVTNVELDYIHSFTIYTTFTMYNGKLIVEII